MQFDGADSSVYLVCMAIAVPLLLLITVGTTLNKRRQLATKLQRATIVGEYKVPLKLTPAEIGYMYEIKLSRRQVLATLLDLRRRGIVSIDEDMSISLVTEDLNKLLPHEWQLAKRLGDDGPQSLEEFIRTTLMKDFEQRVRSSLVTKGYMKTRSIFSTLFAGWLKMFLILVIGLAVIFLAWKVVKMDITSAASFFLVPMVVVITAIVYLPLNAIFAAILIVIHVYISGQSGLGTQRLLVDWPKVEGFRAFVKEMEQGKLRYADTSIQQQTVALCEAYAVAFGFGSNWRARITPAAPVLNIAKA